MVKKITIGEREVEMRADGATPYLYKAAFKGDLIAYFTNPGNEGDNADMATKLAYVMARQAECPNPREIKLSEEDMIDWLVDFGPMDVTMAAEEILLFYMGTTLTTSTAKKKAAPRSES